MSGRMRLEGRTAVVTGAALSRIARVSYWKVLAGRMRK